jgi:hypothetical protein
MSANPMTDASTNTDRFYTVIKSMVEFDKAEVKGVLDTLLSPNPRENCFIGTYYRTLGNIETLLKLDKSKDFQAIAMLARALFELAVDMRLLQKIPDGCLRVLVHADIEKLRVAQNIIGFKVKNPTADIDTKSFDVFVEQHSSRITGLQNSLWPGMKKVKHWSGQNLADRVKFLGSPFDQIYAVDYSRISWYVHPGLTGIMNVPAVTFIHLCAYAFHLAATAYEESLLTLIRQFKISTTNERIEDHLQAAKMYPFTNSPEEENALTRFLIGNEGLRQ